MDLIEELLTDHYNERAGETSGLTANDDVLRRGYSLRKAQQRHRAALLAVLGVGAAAVAAVGGASLGYSPSTGQVSEPSAPLFLSTSANLLPGCGGSEFLSPDVSISTRVGQSVDLKLSSIKWSSVRDLTSFQFEIGKPGAQAEVLPNGGNAETTVVKSDVYPSSRTSALFSFAPESPGRYPVFVVIRTHGSQCLASQEEFGMTVQKVGLISVTGA